MNFGRVRCLLFLSFCSIPLQAQQNVSTSVQGATILRQAAAAVGGGVAILDVTLTGTARRIAGSDDETGTVVLKALATGQSSLDFAYPSGQTSEIASNALGGIPTGTWTGSDGKAHPISPHNLMTDSCWFFPALTLTKVLSSPTSIVTLVGQETKGGISSSHLTLVQQTPSGPADVAPLEQHLSEMDVFLDATSLLPVFLDFYVHPDNNALLDIPVEIRFSDYRAVNGVQIPFHIQRYLNNGLFLDIQLQAATLNSGLTAGAFSIQ